MLLVEGRGTDGGLKMVTGGWYYCPTPESDDFVACPYCSLALDGWEPKDKPLYESFFL